MNKWFTKDNTEGYQPAQLDELNRRYDAALGVEDDSLPPEERFDYMALVAHFDRIAERVLADYDSEIAPFDDQGKNRTMSQTETHYIVLDPATGAHLRAATPTEAAEFTARNAAPFDKPTTVSTGALVDIDNGPGIVRYGPLQD